MKYLLDSTFVIDHLRDDPVAQSRFRVILEHGDDGRDDF